MKLKTDKIKKLHHSLIFSMDLDAFESKMDSEYLALQKTVKTKGFRKGKTPLAQTKAMYAEQVRYRVIQNEAEKSLKAYYADKNVRPAATPKVDIKEEKKAISLDVELDVLPDMPDFDFSKIKLEKEITPVDDDQIQTSLKNLAESRRTMEKMTEKRPLKKGDVAVIDFEGFLDDKPFEGGKGERHFLELGSNQFIPGFEEALIGKELGKTDVHVTFPKDYGAKHLAGKAVLFKVDVKEIRTKVLPEINDDFAKELKLKDLADLKKTITEQLQKQNDDQSMRLLKDKLLDALTDKIKLDLPQSLVDQEVHMLKEQHKDMKEKDILKQAEQRVKLGLLLGDLGKKFEIKISQQEMKQSLIQQAMMARHPNPQQLLKDFDKNPNQFSGLYAMIFEDKVLVQLLDKVTITEKTVKSKK
ncbi:MAG: trigger factor [Alphaproteobacteria bacterium]|nr:trigger factor [Alphaproteobacteria bacterium]